MNKKAITILGAIFLLIVGTLVFLIFQRRSANKNKTTTPNPVVTPTPVTVATPLPTGGPTPTPDGGTTVYGSNKAIKLTDENVVSPVLFYKGNGVAYFTGQGQLYQADIDASSSELKLTNKRELGVPTKSGITKIYWPAAGNNYIAEMQSSNGSHAWSVYVSDKGEYVDVPKQVTNFTWTPDGEQLMYLWLDNNKTNLNIAPPDLATWRVLTDIWENDDAISMSPDGKTILFWRTASADATNNINLVTPDGKLFRSVVKDGFNSGVVWSPDSQKFAFNKKSATGFWQLWVGNLSTGEVQNMNVEAVVDKVVWTSDGKSMYVAAATSGSGEHFLLLDAATGKQQSIDLDSSVLASDLFLSKDGTKLFFKNNVDGSLYYVDLATVALN